MPRENELKTYEQVAETHELDPLTASRFVKYMRLRWADEEHIQCATGYAGEWAKRFKNHVEFGASDREGQRILMSGDLTP